MPLSGFGDLTVLFLVSISDGVPWKEEKPIYTPSSAKEEKAAKCEVLSSIPSSKKEEKGDSFIRS